MAKFETSLWFPTFGRNRGYLSSQIKLRIEQITEYFDFDIVETFYEEQESFVIIAETKETPENLEYIRKTLSKEFGSYYKVQDLSVGDEVLGRLIQPGKVGFGIFVDIGIVDKQDILIPLFQLRKIHPNFEDLSTRKIVGILGLVDGMPVSLTLLEKKQANIQAKIRLIASFSSTFRKNIIQWDKEKLQKMIITKCFNSTITSVIEQKNLNKFIEKVEMPDPLTTIITCKKRTRATGLIPIIGPIIGNSPIGIFNPSKINKN